MSLSVRTDDSIFSAKDYQTSLNKVDCEFFNVTPGVFKNNYKALCAVAVAAYIDDKIKHQFLEFINAINVLAKKGKLTFNSELRLMMLSGFTLADDLAHPGIENRDEKITSLVATIKAINVWIAKNHHVQFRNEVIDAVDHMQKIISPPNFFQFSNPALRVMVGVIGLMIGMALLLTTPFPSLGSVLGMAFNAIGGTFLLFAFDTDKTSNYAGRNTAFIDDTTKVLNKLSIFTRSTMPVVPVVRDNREEKQLTRSPALA